MTIVDEALVDVASSAIEADCAPAGAVGLCFNLSSCRHDRKDFSLVAGAGTHIHGLRRGRSPKTGRPDRLRGLDVALLFQLHLLQLFDLVLGLGNRNCWHEDCLGRNGLQDGAGLAGIGDLKLDRGFDRRVRFCNLHCPHLRIRNILGCRGRDLCLRRWRWRCLDKDYIAGKGAKQKEHRHGADECYRDGGSSRGKVLNENLGPATSPPIRT